MIGLGFEPFHAAALNLIANTAPVAWGAIGTPVHVLAAVTALPESDLNAMIGRILPLTAAIVPFWLVRAMVGWTRDVRSVSRHSGRRSLLRRNTIFLVQLYG